MIVKGYTEDGCQIQATHGGLHIETSAERDSRLAAERLTQIERAAPEMLALLVESQTSIGGDWRERRDAIIAKATV